MFNFLKLKKMQKISLMAQFFMNSFNFLLENIPKNPASSENPPNHLSLSLSIISFSHKLLLLHYLVLALFVLLLLLLLVFDKVSVFIGIQPLHVHPMLHRLFDYPLLWHFFLETRIQKSKPGIRKKNQIS